MNCFYSAGHINHNDWLYLQYCSGWYLFSFIFHAGEMFSMRNFHLIIYSEIDAGIPDCRTKQRNTHSIPFILITTLTCTHTIALLQASLNPYEEGENVWSKFEKLFYVVRTDSVNEQSSWQIVFVLQLLQINIDLINKLFTHRSMPVAQPNMQNITTYVIPCLLVP